MWLSKHDMAASQNKGDPSSCPHALSLHLSKMDAGATTMMPHSMKETEKREERSKAFFSVVCSSLK